MKKELEKSEIMRIEDIMNNFDFKKVHSVMVLMNWQWYSSISKTGVPALREIKKTAKRLLNDALICSRENKNVDIEISTGGFKARYAFSTDSLHLYFIISDWDDSITTSSEEYIKMVEKETIRNKRINCIKNILKEC
jgi:hypothetical protein